MGLLGDIYSGADTIKRRVKGLLSDPVGSMQQAVDNAFPTTYEAQNAIAQLRGQPYNHDALQAYNTKLDSAAMNFAPMGITVWHGSPHKFSKFDMSKIGTGEGAQAYGHGLYMAETPAVAREYAENLGKEVMIKGKPAYQAKNGTQAGDLPISSPAAGVLRMNDWDLQKALKQAEDDFVETGDQWFAKVHSELSSLKPDDIQIKNGQMYKVDIPDEAVARFLDWDKPLSQQAPEVRAVLQDMPNYEGSQLHSMLIHKFGSQDKVNDYLKQQGIPGIRYLDGGSRSAGQGSSNFVLFDDQLPRILETNGVPTGLLPWQPGEWKGLLK